MYVLVCYDVATDMPEGQRRLRRVAHVCEGFGQRVQKSVFECVVDEVQLESLRQRLLSEIKMDEDNLRIYRLRQPQKSSVEEYGVFRARDFEEPLIV